LLQEGCNAARYTIATLHASLDEVPNLDTQSLSISGASGTIWRIQKTDNKPSQLLVNESFLLSFLGIIMKKTHPIARLRQQCTTSKIACLMLL
jgi:hypothetical protein